MAEQIYRPYGLVINGTLEHGLEVLIKDGKILEIRPHTGTPEPYILSPAFVNAHSHLEYRGMLDQIKEPEYWSWIVEITRLKKLQDMEQVRQDTLLAAQENYDTGVALIGEFSDRPYAGEGMATAGVGGIIFQEVLTIGLLNAADNFNQAKQRAEYQRQYFDGPVYLSPHAAYTVDKSTLEYFGTNKEPFSIHVAETELENDFFLGKPGPIAELCANFKGRVEPVGKRVFGYLEQLGLVRTGAQFIHCCALNEEEKRNTFVNLQPFSKCFCSF